MTSIKNSFNLTLWQHGKEKHIAHGFCLSAIWLFTIHIKKIYTNLRIYFFTLCFRFQQIFPLSEVPTIVRCSLLRSLSAALKVSFCAVYLCGTRPYTVWMFSGRWECAASNRKEGFWHDGVQDEQSPTRTTRRCPTRPGQKGRASSDRCLQKLYQIWRRHWENKLAVPSGSMPGFCEGGSIPSPG